jgi:hypothetical protein
VSGRPRFTGTPPIYGVLKPAEGEAIQDRFPSGGTGPDTKWTDRTGGERAEASASVPLGGNRAGHEVDGPKGGERAEASEGQSDDGLRNAAGMPATMANACTKMSDVGNSSPRLNIAQPPIRILLPRGSGIRSKPVR